jgi:hypothetical protein
VGEQHRFDRREVQAERTASRLDRRPVRGKTAVDQSQHGAVANQVTVDPFRPDTEDALRDLCRFRPRPHHHHLDPGQPRRARHRQQPCTHSLPGPTRAAPQFARGERRVRSASATSRPDGVLAQIEPSLRRLLLTVLTDGELRIGVSYDLDHSSSLRRLCRHWQRSWNRALVRGHDRLDGREHGLGPVALDATVEQGNSRLMAWH